MAPRSVMSACHSTATMKAIATSDTKNAFNDARSIASFARNRLKPAPGGKYKGGRILEASTRRVNGRSDSFFRVMQHRGLGDKRADCLRILVVLSVAHTLLNRRRYIRTAAGYSCRCYVRHRFLIAYPARKLLTIVGHQLRLVDDHVCGRCRK